ncbi:flagellar basal body rod protein FlgB [Hathewaya massiliensis]|uniref:flagellar basal body rod protein FlgB n=1 Tax=Hathewaya massiliensis TaxID=1964382 RepID=UPI001157B611|nr:flagellar basal body rod protein FlgB [Hathewaya massiliensis]
MKIESNIFNNYSSSSNIYNKLKANMDIAIKRKEVLSDNFANINTKGYKRFDVVLNEELGKDNINMKKTVDKHIGDFKDGNGFKIVKDTSGTMRNDGNNVDPEIEMINIASNAILYNTLVTQINNEFSMKTSVIKGGK